MTCKNFHICTRRRSRNFLHIKKMETLLQIYAYFENHDLKATLELLSPLPFPFKTKHILTNTQIGVIFNNTLICFLARFTSCALLFLAANVIKTLTPSIAASRRSTTKDLRHRLHKFAWTRQTCEWVG